MEDVIFVRQRAYVKTRFVGRGTFGKIYLVRDTEEKYLYALKQINIENHSHASAIKTEFLAMLASLRHRHIIHLFSCAISKSSKSQLVANFIMEYCPGGTLNDRLSIPNSKVLDLKWMVQIADAVTFLHQKEIVHRDLKADNVLLTVSNNVKICDLGLASFSIHLRHCGSSSKSLGPDQVVGTPCFWSPELFNGCRHQKSSDVFALGHILYAIKERCYIKRKPMKRLYGAFITTIDRGAISLGQAQSKSSQPCNLAFAPDKNVVDRGIRNITAAVLAYDAESRPKSEQVYQHLKLTARMLVTIIRDNSQQSLYL
ncbi:serine/threonine-protein kinase Nek4 [Exaiptasia diaphana]|uniref:Protein kinase domain-containing protein n=1 Tax=Exaiptasia diaphana TaxID=2652724 RepID=A0A913YXB8_EXADI|nr:serine/threonine-protein kinase Nek4 [Exaiptasia diaphana]XP_028519723.1 serine/threonine-protein kinase Nek4 [Exaiptasia diaphana]